ncbi:MAG: UDP-N-acetylmuramoyl-L-alanyl-D-glutamate--2,6-diaminopimelate ligase [Candidatus Peribacteraceae bacterium]|nr:UDP-N-acetylmuramoyl-L-alanyl-D-glutamate--2,6-diaminopimelate ligase [Candidatus Peribacteraceae bacterium]
MTLQSAIGDQHPLRLLWHRGRAIVAAVRAGLPARKLTIVGITGTDGKTTTVGMVTHILNQLDVPAGSLSTASFSVKGKTEPNPTQKTSPSPVLIQRFLKRLVDEGCTHAVLEYSSHGLTQGRTLCTWPTVGAITNLSPEHLDYHGTMAAYTEAKSKLFRMLTAGGVKVLNREDQTWAIYRTIPTARTVTFGLDKPATPSGGEDLWVEGLTATIGGSEATVVSSTGWRAPLHLPVAGDFNVKNALTAVGCAIGLGLDPQTAIRALGSFGGVQGRLEQIDEGQAFSVFVDFTVTPASYRTALSSLRARLPAGKRLIVVMGSCGDRMKEKRPEIGRIASELADVVIVTNEDPYGEDPKAIIDEVFAAVDKQKVEAHRISDRGEAIAQALTLAAPGDIVLLAGKGSDTTMWTAQGQVPWNEREIAREMLKELET